MYKYIISPFMMTEPSILFLRKSTFNYFDFLKVWKNMSSQQFRVAICIFKYLLGKYFIKKQVDYDFNMKLYTNRPFSIKKIVSVVQSVNNQLMVQSKNRLHADCYFPSYIFILIFWFMIYFLSCATSVDAIVVGLFTLSRICRRLRKNTVQIKWNGNCFVCVTYETVFLLIYLT